jgi:hypothetical protein
MRRGPHSLSLGAIYVVIGVIVAAVNDYFDDLSTGLRIGEAVVAVFIWPFVLFGVDVELK